MEGRGNTLKQSARVRARKACAKLDANDSKGKVAAMLDRKVFEDINDRLGAIIAASPVADLEKNARAVLSGLFEKLDLVSREEFDVQAQVLLRTREKLKALEARVTLLESRNAAKPDVGTGDVAAS